MPDFSHEIRLGGLVAGLDEVGRGPLAGPVIAAAVLLDAATLPTELLALDDSKKLSAKKREKLAELVWQHGKVGLGVAEVEEIDRINILQATFAAMGRAVQALGCPIDHVLVDGNQRPPLSCPVTCLVGGDGLSLSIAAASVVAKVHRDQLMAKLAQDWPGYGWEKNAGYGTKQHMEAVTRQGITPHHRRSFAPIAQRTLF